MFALDESEDPAVAQAFKNFTSQAAPELSLWSTLTQDQFRHFMWICVNHCPRMLIAAWPRVKEVYIAPAAHSGSLQLVVERLVRKLAYVDRPAYIMLNDAPPHARQAVLEQIDPLSANTLGWFDRHVPTLELLVDTLYELASVYARVKLLASVLPKFATADRSSTAQVIRGYVSRCEAETDKSRRDYNPDITPWILEQFPGRLVA